MIEIVLGNVGSGKTASAVRDIVLNESNRVTYSNIATKKIKNNIPITKEMLVIKEVLGVRKNGEEIVKYSFNRAYWEKVIKKQGAINVIIDEAHAVLSSRTAMSKQNRIMTDFLAMLRRILGSNSSGYGRLVLITHLERRLDVIAREMATAIKWHVCHYTKTCTKCHISWKETNETPEPVHICPQCETEVIMHNHIIEVWHFSNMQRFHDFKELGLRTYHRHYIINDIDQYFKFYNTFQWEELLSDL